MRRFFISADLIYFSCRVHVFAAGSTYNLRVTDERKRDDQYREESGAQEVQSCHEG